MVSEFARERLTDFLVEDRKFPHVEEWRIVKRGIGLSGLSSPESNFSPITFPVSPGSEQEGDKFCLGILDFFATLSFQDTFTESNELPCSVDLNVIGNAGCLDLNCEGLSWYFEGLIPHYDSPSMYLERHNNNQVHRNEFGELEYYAGLSLSSTGQGPITGEKLELAQAGVRELKQFPHLSHLSLTNPIHLEAGLRVKGGWPYNARIDGRQWLDLGCCDCEEPLDPYESDLVTKADPHTAASLSLEQGQKGEFKANGAAQFPEEVSGVSPPPGPGQTPGPCTSTFQKNVQFTVNVPRSFLNVGATRLPDGTIKPVDDTTLDVDAMANFARDAATNEAVSTINQAIQSGQFKCPDH